MIPPVSSVNYHVWQACNMRCRFCFATFQGVREAILPLGHLDELDSLKVVWLLAKAGFKKINFAGGEPLLCPWIGKLVDAAKRFGMVVSLVTNGALFDMDSSAGWFSKLDWFVLSVDSIDAGTLRRTGRELRRGPMSGDRYVEICRQVREVGVQIKINTVVTSANQHEDLTGFIRHSRPQRWKIMQMLPLDGQDCRRADDLAVSPTEFAEFVRRNRAVPPGVKIVVEANATMIGSYAMVDPAGRFYDNVTGAYRYSKPILEVGVQKALLDVVISHALFEQRGGEYDGTGTGVRPFSPAWAMAGVLQLRSRRRPGGPKPLS
jgi:radical S-adenosyl methionine domain-containing protein 2